MSPSGGRAVNGSQGKCGARGTVFREENIAGQVYGSIVLCTVVFLCQAIVFTFSVIFVCFPVLTKDKLTVYTVLQPYHICPSSN